VNCISIVTITTALFEQNRHPRSERKCELCNLQEIEDEFHFIIICNCYTALRREFIKPYLYRRPSMFKFLQLLKSKNKSELIGLAKYIIFASKRRYDLINITI
jgi:hypothetical protein